MDQKVRAVYRAGAFVPEEPCDIPEELEVEFIIPGPPLLLPEVTDPVERASLLRLITERMRKNPIPAEARRLTREELHERR